MFLTVRSIAIANETIELQLRDIQTLPLYGTFESGHLAANGIQMPDSFVGQELRGRLRMVNTFAVPIRVQKLSSTCGCTTGLASQDPVTPGASSDLIVAVKVSKPGMYGVRLSVETNQGILIVQLSGKCIDPLAIRKSEVKYSPANKTFSLPFDIKDEAISVDSLVFHAGGVQLECAKLGEKQVMVELPIRPGEIGFNGVLAALRNG